MLILSFFVIDVNMRAGSSIIILTKKDKNKENINENTKCQEIRYY